MNVRLTIQKKRFPDGTQKKKQKTHVKPSKRTPKQDAKA